MRAIDGDALSDWMKDYGQKCINGERKISLMYVWKHIQDMQTIEERKTGEWRVLKDRSSGQEFSCCNRCDHYYSANTSDWNFCPNCGTRMLRWGDE